jgi:hypothetical protein
MSAAVNGTVAPSNVKPRGGRWGDRKEAKVVPAQSSNSNIAATETKGTVDANNFSSGPSNSQEAKPAGELSAVDEERIAKQSRAAMLRAQGG